jgi:enterochelin esterase-like enzyme
MRFHLVIILYIFSLVSNKLNGQSFAKLNSEINGTVYRSLEFNSKILNNRLKYSIYLPPYYHTSNDSFPVLYLLHGYGGSETSWINRCNIHRIVDSLIQIGAIPSMIIIMPEGRNSYYINDFQQQFPYEDIFISELIPFIDSVYKTIPHKGYRIIGGLSMGGYGALILSIKHPDIFGACISLSAAVRTDEMIMNEDTSNYNNKFSLIYGSVFQGDVRINEYWKSYSPFYLLSDSISDKLKSIHWYFDCGMNDHLIKGNEALHAAFVNLGIPHEYHVRVGSHNLEYWKKSIIEGIIYAGHSIR